VALAVRAADAVAARATFAVFAVTSRATLARSATRAALSTAARARDVPELERGVDAVARDFTGAVPEADPAAVREVPGALARVLRLPEVGAARPVVGRSGWSEVMHLASVGDSPLGSPGEEEAGAM